MTNRRLPSAALLFVLCASEAHAQEATESSVRADLARLIVDNDTGEVSPEDFRVVVGGVIDLIPTIAEIMEQVAAWARFSPVGTIPPEVLAAGGSPGALLSRTATGQQWLAATLLDLSDVDGRIAPAARAGSSDRWGIGKLPAQLARLPAADCSAGQIWKRGSAVFACDADSDTLPALWALRTGASTRAPLSALPAQLSRVPADDCLNGQIWKRTGGVWGCAPDAVGAGGGIDLATATALTAEWARASNTDLVPSVKLAASPAAARFLRATSATARTWAAIADDDLPGSITRDTELRTDEQINALADDRVSEFARYQSSTTIPISRLATGGAVNDVITRTGATAFGWRALPDIPDNSDIDARIESFAHEGNATASNPVLVPARIIDNAIARDGELPVNMLVGNARGPDTATVGQVPCRFRDGAGQDRDDFDWCTLSHVVDASSLTMALTRSNTSTAAVQVPISSSFLDPQHALTISSGCVVVGTTGGGWYFYSANAQVTPNRSDDGDPTDEGGPHRNFADWQIRRTRGAVTSTIFHTTPYVRGFQTGSSPASQWVSFDGRVPVNAGDRICIYVDSSANSAHQADYLTISDGEIALTSDRWVFAP